MSGAAGSYEFGKFTDNQAELARLDRQASLVLPREMEMLRQVGLKPGMRVVDLACGSGIVACEIAREIGNSGEVVGLELNRDLVASAQARGQVAESANLRFVAGNIYAPELPEATFDFAYARMVFQHLKYPLAALDAIRRLLKPGGILCIADVDDSWLKVHPEPASFKPFLDAAASGQQARGGNRRIGRELPRLLLESGFAAPRLDIEVITSSVVGMRAFLAITMGLKREQIDPAGAFDAAAALAEIDALADLPASWGAVGVFIASACRPRGEAL